MKNKLIEVDFISRSMTGVTVHFNNGAVQLFDYTMNAQSGVIFNERELKAERFTKKYNEALQVHLNARTTVITNDNKNGVSHNVYVVGDLVTAQKFQNGKMVQSYIWNGVYGSTEKMIEDLKKSWHEQYNVIEVADVEEIAVGQALETVAQIKTIEGLQADNLALANLTDSLVNYYKNFKNTFLYNVSLDGAQSLHFIFETVQNEQSSFVVHSAYFNGFNERTTYSGLHRGIYDLDISKATYWATDRLERGFLGLVGFRF